MLHPLGWALDVDDQLLGLFGFECPHQLDQLVLLFHRLDLHEVLGLVFFYSWPTSVLGRTFKQLIIEQRVLRELSTMRLLTMVIKRSVRMIKLTTPFITTLVLFNDPFTFGLYMLRILHFYGVLFHFLDYYALVSKILSKLLYSLIVVYYIVLMVI